MVYDVTAQTDGKFRIIECELSGKTGQLLEGDMTADEAHYLKKKLDENGLSCEDCGEAKHYHELWENYGKCNKCFNDMTEEDREAFSMERILSCWTLY